MCTPFDGASAFAPIPQPPNPPPYGDVPWVPPYNEANMLGGIPLAINPETGILTGTPNTIGQFVVGICAEEYRNGELISTTRRDFQYNVGLCEITTSSFFAPTIQCGNLSVQFENLSVSADDFQWYFNDPNNPNANSQIISPIYTFSDTGIYTIMLVAEPNNICADTSYQTIELYFDSLEPDFEFEFGDCSDSLVVEVTDLSTDFISTISEWNWELDTGTGTILTSNLQNPTFAIYSGQTVTLTLNVIAENGCAKTLSKTFDIPLLEDELIAENLTICAGDSVFLNPDFLPNADYVWSPSLNLSDPNTPNPLAFPDDLTTYSVTISDNSILDCEIIKEITIDIAPLLIAGLPNDTVTCEPDIVLTANSNFWSRFYLGN